MARETLASLRQDRDDWHNLFDQANAELSEVTKQLRLKVEDTAKYQSLENQLAGEKILLKSAIESSKRYEDRVKSREAEIEDLKKQNALLIKKYKEMQALPIFAGNPENPLPDPTVDELKAKIERLVEERTAAEKRADRMNNNNLFLQDAWQITGKKNRELSIKYDDAIAAQNELKAELEETRKELQQVQEKLLEPHVEPHNARGAGRKPKLNDEQRGRAKTLSSQGLSIRKIAEVIGVSPATILRCLRD